MHPFINTWRFSRPRSYIRKALFLTNSGSVPLRVLLCFYHCKPWYKQSCLALYVFGSLCCCIPVCLAKALWWHAKSLLKTSFCIFGYVFLVIQYVLVTSSYFYNHRSSSSALFSDTIHGDVLHIAVKSTLHSKLALEFFRWRKSTYFCDLSFTSCTFV